MNRKEILQQQRDLVDKITADFNELNRLNSLVESHDKTDILLIMGQHRHHFEEQQVADHSQCVTIQCVTGSYEGICGGLAMLANTSALGKRMIMEIYGFLTRKNRCN